MKREPPRPSRTEVMEPGKIYLAGDLTIRAYPDARMLRIGEINFGFEFLTCFDAVGLSFRVIKKDDGVVSVEQLRAGHIVGESGLQ